jgi:hypothetical protein
MSTLARDMAPADYSIIYEAVHGSRAFGLDTAHSDIDVRGIIVGPAGWYHGFLESPEQIELSSEHTLYDVRKFFLLAAAANPTALELLWADPAHLRILTAAGRRLLDSRHRFLSRRVEDTFSGYAMSQLRRIRGHRSWLLNPPTHRPIARSIGRATSRKLAAPRGSSVGGPCGQYVARTAAEPTGLRSLAHRDARQIRCPYSGATSSAAANANSVVRLANERLGRRARCQGSSYFAIDTRTKAAPAPRCFTSRGPGRTRHNRGLGGGLEKIEVDLAHLEPHRTGSGPRPILSARRTVISHSMHAN